MKTYLLKPCVLMVKSFTLRKYYFNVLLLLNNEDVVCAYTAQRQVQRRGHKKTGRRPGFLCFEHRSQTRNHSSRSKVV